MSKAKMAGEFCKAMSLMKFPDDAMKMSTYCTDWLTFAEITSEGSHKYVPTERLNTELGLQQGAGVFGYLRFADGSYLLKTCDNGLAHWGGGEDKPELISFEATPKTN